MDRRSWRHSREMRCLWRGSEWKVMILEGRPVGGEQRKGQRQWTNSTVSVEPV